MAKVFNGNRRVAFAYGFLILCMLAYTVSEIVRPPSDAWPLVDDWGVPVFELVAVALCLGRAFTVRHGRKIPVVLGLGLLAWALGDLVLAYESLGGDPPTPSAADAFYICFYPLTYIALMMLMRRQVKRFTIATWLDGGVAGLGAAAICAAFVVHSLAHSGGGVAATATNLIYPVGDLLLVAMIVGGTAVLPGRISRQWGLLAIAYSIVAIGDTLNLFGSGIGATHFGVAFDAIAWPTTVLLVSLSVWLTPRRTDVRSHEHAPGYVLPGLAAAAALVILLVGALTHVNTVALVLATATLAAAGVRFLLSQRTLRSLTEERYTQAVTDQLTTLGNRRALFELLETLGTENALADSGPRTMAFLFVDLNRFKEVNDSFGHSVGDELLRCLGERLKDSLRSSDLVVRLGGDEFAVVLTDAGADHGAMVAQRISARLEEPFVLGAVRAQISASIGIAVMPTDATDPHDLLRCADLAMYRAKLAGKCFAIYNEELDGHGNRLGLVEELRVAIEQRELQLHFQTQVDLSSGQVVGVEALVRWAHERLGYIPPLEFLPLAEDAGMMDALTEFVLDEALAQCARWRVTHPTVAVSVNISTTNLLNPDFTASVSRMLARHGLAPDALVLEITETTAITDFDRCRLAIEQLRDLGLVVSVDDFGAGFTSLAYLSSLAVGELKLDRSFVNALVSGNESRDHALVSSTIDLAHALGMRVVAEGVEDDASFALLAKLNCDLAQGYVISKPKPASELNLEPYAAAAPARLAA
jgi:diguanylate cyclase (GGDEF)-like protein